jgi:parallel beta-helix repeat protein
MTENRSRAGWSIAVAVLVVLGIFLTPTMSVHPAPHGRTSSLRGDFSASLSILSNGTVSMPGVFAISGNTYTLLTNYSGSIGDFRAGSVLLGAGYLVNHTNGTAGLFILANNVSVRGFHFIGTGESIEVYSSSHVDLVDNNLSASGDALVIILDDSVIASDNLAGSTTGVFVSESVGVRIDGSNFASSSYDGIVVYSVAGLTLLNNDFSGALVNGMVLENSSSVVALGNSFAGATANEALDLSDVYQGNFSSNNLTGNLDPVVMENCGNLSLWNNTISPGADIGYSVELSNSIRIAETAVLSPVMAGASLFGDVNTSFVGVDFSFSGEGIEDIDSFGVLIEDSILADDASAVDAEESSNLTIVSSNLAGGNNGLYAVQTASISVQDSNLTRANYPLNLTDGTRDVAVGGSDLDGAQVDGAYLNGVSDITIDHSTIRSASNYAVYSVFTQGLTISSTDLSDTPGDPGNTGVATHYANGTALLNDSLEWMASPFLDTGSVGIQFLDSNFSNTTDGGIGISLLDDQEVVVADCSFFNDSGVGITGDLVTDLSITGSNFDDLEADGVLLDNSAEVTATDNALDNEGENGIFLANIQDFVASGNSLTNDSYALFLSSGASVTLINNTALDDQDGGLAANNIDGFVMARNNFSADSAADLTTISLVAILGLSFIGNHLDQDNEALAVSGISEGSIVGNYFLDDNLSFDLEAPLDVLVYHNDFIGDGGWSLQDSPKVAWDDGYPVGGNYWSNYTGGDQFSGPNQTLPGSDGIGDTPFVLDESDLDHFPLMTPWAEHAVTFVETGLPNGAAWNVVFNGTDYRSTMNSITVLSVVGVLTPYQYSIPNVGNYAASPADGTGTLGGSPAAITVTFAVPAYTLSFNETGLPSSTSWAVQLNGTTYATTDPTLTLNLPNATYPYSVLSVAGFTPTPGSGSVTIHGSSGSVAVSFVPVTYDVTVVEGGLANGTPWSITVGLTTTTATGPRLSLSLANGSYLFTLGIVSGYTPTPTGGGWIVSGGPVTIYVTFVSNATKVSPAPGSTATGSTPSLLGYEVAIAALLIAAIIGWLLAIRYRRRAESLAPIRPDPPTPPPPGAG